MLRGFKYRLQPTAAQAETFEQYAGVCRLIYNLAWEQRRNHWRQFARASSKHISAASQSLEVSELRRQCDWIAAVPRTPIEQALRDLDGAFRKFFAGGGYPRPRRKGEDDTFRFRGHEVRSRRLNSKWSVVYIPKIGWVKYRDTRPLSDVRNATISRHCGQWFISFQCDVGAPASANDLPAVGIDRGVAQAITLSTGEVHVLPAMQGRWKALARAQRALARRKRGSRRYARQRARVAILRARTARLRKDFLHRASASIARRFSVVAIEDLRVANMTAAGRGKRGINRSILDQGWGMFAAMLEYKLEAAGGRLVTVPAAYTSQTCSACGVIDSRSRKSQAVFECVACGHRDNADTNAAIEIRRRSTALLRGEAQTIEPANRELEVAA